MSVLNKQRQPPQLEDDLVFVNSALLRKRLFTQSLNVYSATSHERDRAWCDSTWELTMAVMRQARYLARQNSGMNMGCETFPLALTIWATTKARSTTVYLLKNVKVVHSEESLRDSLAGMLSRIRQQLDPGKVHDLRVTVRAEWDLTPAWKSVIFC